MPCYNIVMTKKKIKNKWKNVLFTDARPKVVLKQLQQKDFKTVLLFGGAKVNSSFLKQGLVDEFYLYVVPMAFGDGMTLISKMNLEVKLELRRIDRFSDGIIGLHYKVIKIAKRIKIHS